MTISVRAMGQISPFVDADWLTEHLDEVITVDLRASSGAKADTEYLAGHIPGALLLDVDETCNGPASSAEGAKPLPSPEHFATQLGLAGIGEDAVVVAYDGEGAHSARLVWMLRAIGSPAAVLDGGLAGWRGPLETATSRRGPVARAPRPWPAELLVSIEEVDANSGVLIDVRGRDRYLGNPTAEEPRAGHIPGALSLPWRDQIGASTKLLPREVLTERLAEAGINDETPVIAYCGSGTGACHNALVMEWLGFEQSRIYFGSWSQWSADEQRPIATGAEAGEPS